MSDNFLTSSFFSILLIASSEGKFVDEIKCYGSLTDPHLLALEVSKVLVTDGTNETF